jgi:hypothetical protein
LSSFVSISLPYIEILESEPTLIASMTA